VADALIFTALGAVILRRRVIGPLQRLRHAAVALANGDAGARAPVEGTAEAAELGRAFNHMTDALEGRREALRKAVVELRDANEELRRARAGLDRAERMAAVGRLAAGVAHEVGNPIGSILALLELAARDCGTSEAARGHLARAAREGERVRVILRQLLDFSRPPGGSPVPVDLGAVAEETVALLRAQRRYAEIRFEVRPSGDAPRAHADPGQVSQILLNLALNAADAVAGCPEPRVELLVRPALLRRRAGDPPGFVPARRTPDGVECVVADTGRGIDEEDRERVFDPFFTTKPPGQGTGLGLASASRLAEEQGGALELVAPPEGLATAFALRLPAVRSEAGRGAARAA
jgi:signal transduction histidine kinase